MPIQVVLCEILLLLCVLIAIGHEIKDLWFTNTSGEIEYFPPLLCMEKVGDQSEFEEEESACPYDLCDGSGEYDEGEFDDIRRVKCLCKIDQEDDFSGATPGDR